MPFANEDVTDMTRSYPVKSNDSKAYGNSLEESILLFFIIPGSVFINEVCILRSFAHGAASVTF
jgi:hypothetical protein